MLDIKMIRQNTDEIKERLATRGVKAEKSTLCLKKTSVAANCWLKRKA